MNICCYGSREQLPFLRATCGSSFILEDVPKIGDYETSCGVRLLDTKIFEILQALDQIELSYLAHIPMVLDHENKMYSLDHDFGVQITSAPRSDIIINGEAIFLEKGLVDSDIPCLDFIKDFEIDDNIAMLFPVEEQDSAESYILFFTQQIEKVQRVMQAV